MIQLFDELTIRDIFASGLNASLEQIAKASHKFADAMRAEREG
jgi:hypothetical protein